MSCRICEAGCVGAWCIIARLHESSAHPSGALVSIPVNAGVARWAAHRAACHIQPLRPGNTHSISTTLCRCRWRMFSEPGASVIVADFPENEGPCPCILSASSSTGETHVGGHHHQHASYT